MTFELARVAVAAAVLSAFGCADLERGPAAPAVDAATTADAAPAGDGPSLSFAGDVSPKLTPCARCHVAGSEAGDTRLVLSGNAAMDYATVLMFVDASAPASSRLLAKMSGQGHEGGEIYATDSPEYQTVLRWIQQGARP
ncbi:MAG TPA: hypothetical protein VHK47_02430 [Polyangia bacterium]|jgi:hypothetical protein|nr:hypothetical protein [Polyangia bacterium]